MGDGLMGGAWISERTRERDWRVDALGKDADAHSKPIQLMII
jgi:hypothetical protein